MKNTTENNITAINEQLQENAEKEVSKVETKQAEEKVAHTPPAQNTSAKKPATKKSKIIKAVIISGVSAFVAFVIAVVSIIAIVVSASRVTIDDYITGECVFSGVNGYGSINFEDVIDYEALDKELKGEYKGSDKGTIWGYSDEYAEYLCTSSTDYIEVIYPENNGKLSNGDEVEIVITVDVKGIKGNKVFKKSVSGGEKHTIKYTVEGLSEGTVIDIFDAVESFTIDTTSNNSTSIALKESYIKDYGNGVSVRVEDNKIKVYGDDFYSFIVNVKLATDNIHTDTEKVKLVIGCEQDEHVEKGIIISTAEKEIDATVISWITDGVFNADDLKVLKAKADSVASEEFDIKKFKHSETNFYYYEGGWSGISTMLNFSYSDGKTTYVLWFDDLKKDDNGNVYCVDSQKISYKINWVNGKIAAYDSVEAYEKQEIVFQNKYQITIPN